jgi:biopolymer transport protein ExbB
MPDAINEFLQPIIDGGWVMVPLFLLGLITFGLGFRLILWLLPVRGTKVTDEQCRRWVADPSTAGEQIREILLYTSAGEDSVENIRSRFEEVRLTELPRINVNLNVLNVLVATAPLLGLLGTVLGMLALFGALATGNAGRMTELVADGIRVALITTEMGLFLAIPGTYLVYLVRQMRNSFFRLLVRLENVAIQQLNRGSC